MAPEQFGVKIYDTLGNDVSISPSLTFLPDRWGDMDYGGPDFARIDVVGPSTDLGNLMQWLYHEIRILNANNTTVWWGYINEIETLPNRSATIHCLGWWHMLDARYYENLSGRVEAPEGSDENMLGYELFSSEIGFDGDGDRLHCGEGNLTALIPGAQVFIAGTVSANAGLKTVKSESNDETASLTSTSIVFDPNDDIELAAGGLDVFQAGKMLEVTGSASNSGWHHIKTVTPTRLEISPGFYGSILIQENAGPSITLESTPSIELEEATVTDEQPGDLLSVTAYGERVAQKFTNDSGAAFTVDKIAVRLRKVGSPADNVVVELWSDSGGSLNALLDSGTIAPANIGTTMAWEWASLSNTDSIADGTDYWVVVRRASSNEPDNCYIIGVDESSTAGLDNVQVYDGSAYQQRSPTANLTFRVWGGVETTEQIDTMITQNGQVFESVEIIDASGVETNQYRDGLSLLRTEVEALLNQGDSAGDAMRAWVDTYKAVMVLSRPTNDDPDFVVTDGNAVTYRTTPLDEVINRVQVFYTYTDVNGNTVNEFTDWSSNNDSITRYGYRELRHSEADLDDTQADAMRERILAERAMPSATVDINDEAMLWRYGGQVEPGRMVSGHWLEIGSAPLSEAALIITSPIYIAASEYDAKTGRIRISPPAAADPWNMGMVQG
jgi:hypothetical protein